MSCAKVLIAVSFIVLQLGCTQSQVDAHPRDKEQRTPSTTNGTKTQACMIAGQFNLAGKGIRSRDCTQTSRDMPRTDFEEYCNMLAQTSAQLGGEAGRITYLDQCPSPNQGSCKNFASSGMDGFYYERTPDDLADLPESCVHGGGTWVK